jgi:hypothetical protein
MNSGRSAWTPTSRFCARGDDVVPVTPKAFETLLFLVPRGREVVSKDELHLGFGPRVRKARDSNPAKDGIRPPRRARK